MTEFLLSICYFSVFCYIISKLSFFKNNGVPNYWFIIIFGIKVIASILLTLIYTQYYPDRDTADIFKYFDDSSIMFNAIKSNPVDYIQMLLGFDMDYRYFHINYYHFMNHWSRPYSSDLISDSHIIIRFNAFVRLFSFGYFQVHNIFINFVSLIGLTAIFKAFKPFLIHKEKVLFYTIFLIPSVVFWGSGLLKEGIIFFAFGILLLQLFRFANHVQPVTVIIIVVAVLLIVFTKFYLLIALTIPILGYLINRFVRVKQPIFAYLISGSIVLLTVIIAPYINDQLDVVFQIANKQQTFSRFINEVPTNSGFIIPELSDGISIVRNIPNALLNTLVRPYLWECSTPFVWMSALENTFILILIVITVIYKSKTGNQEKNLIWFNLSFVFCLFALIGLTTPVFGAIVRYKIPGLILLLISLLLFIDLEKIKTKHPLLDKVL